MLALSINHMSMLSRLSLIASLILVASYVLTHYKRSRHAVQVKGRGCLPAPIYPHPVWDLLGLQQVGRQMREAKRDRGAEYYVARSEVVSRHRGRRTTTYLVNSLGSYVYYTYDAKNIQAMLATQFGDFVLGGSRPANFAPLLGRGIVRFFSSSPYPATPPP